MVCNELTAGSWGAGYYGGCGEMFLVRTKALMALAAAVVASSASADTTTLTTLTVYNASSAVVGTVSGTSLDEAASPFSIYTVPGVAGNPAAFHDFDTILIGGVPADVVGVTRNSLGMYGLSFGGPAFAAAIGGRNPIAYEAPIDVSRFLAPGLGETAFLTISAIIPAGGGVITVPEPATWAMMIAGFGFVGAAARRRRTAAA